MLHPGPVYKPHPVIFSQLLSALVGPDSGGDDILLQHGGTEAYDAFEEVGHSDFARSSKANLEQRLNDVLYSDGVG